MKYLREYFGHFGPTTNHSQIQVGRRNTQTLTAGPTKFSRMTYPGKGCKFLFASSGACFGERPEGPETDLTKLLPQTSYGMHLVNEANEQVVFFFQLRIHAV